MSEITASQHKISSTADPRHVAIMMDGNGRWAQCRGKPRIVGHRVGATAVRRVTQAAANLGLQQLTLFAFSTENWRRPADEVAFLMRLFRRYLRTEVHRLLENGIRLTAIGRLDGLPPEVRQELEKTISLTSSCEKFTLCLAINYGGRCEIVDACRKLTALAAAGRITPESVDEPAMEAALYQQDMPPLDLIIRTGGEMRLSNFLLWQAAYAELWFTSVCWPDFGQEHLQEAIEAFRRRQRRFGAVSPVRG